MCQADREFVKGHVRTMPFASWERLYKLVGRVYFVNFVIESNEHQA